MTLMLSIKTPRPVVPPLALLAIVAVLVVIVVFGDALRELTLRWSQQEEYSYGFLIPPIVAWLLWRRRDALQASIGQPCFAGLGLIMLAIAMHIIGELSAIFILSQVGFVLALIGLVLAIGGYSLLRVAFIPIAYLLFAIPLPYFIDAKLTLQLQLISSELGVFFIRLFQIRVFLDGNIIDMGSFKLQVVEACSGLRYLYPLLSLSFMAAYLFHARLWQRTLVFLSSIPIAIGMNGFRIGMVGVLVDRWGARMAEGALHFFEGWLIFVACSALLAGEIGLLACLSGRRFFDVFHPPNVTAAPTDGTPAKSWRLVPLMACLALLCIGGLAAFSISGRSEIIPERTRFVAFPTRIGNWQGQDSSLDLATEKFLKVDDYILANYSQSDGNPVNLYVAYYASQRQNEAPHSPIVCLPGGGWMITWLERETFESGGGVDHPFNRVIIKNGAARNLVYYWFDERGRTVASEYMAKWYLLADSIFKNRSDGALIRLTTRINPDESEDNADRRLQAFMRLALPHLKAFLPHSADRPVHAGLSQPTDQHS